MKSSCDAGCRVLLIAAILLADQITKILVRPLAHEAPRHYGPLTLMYTENTGAFLSLGANLPDSVRGWLFNGIVGVLLIGLAIALVRGTTDPVPLALIFAGGTGNLIDRLRFGGRVSDFLYLHAGPLHTGVFNVADMAITAGALGLLLSWGLSRHLHRSQVPR